MYLLVVVGELCGWEVIAFQNVVDDVVTVAFLLVLCCCFSVIGAMSIGVNCNRVLLVVANGYISNDGVVVHEGPFERVVLEAVFVVDFVCPTVFSCWVHEHIVKCVVGRVSFPDACEWFTGIGFVRLQYDVSVAEETVATARK